MKKIGFVKVTFDPYTFINWFQGKVIVLTYNQAKNV